MLSGLAQHANKAKFLLNENSTTILTVFGVVGTVGTAYLTGRATFKAAEIIQEEEKLARTELLVVDKSEGEGREKPSKNSLSIPASELTKIDKTKLVWRHYLLPVSSGVMTIGFIIAANRISTKKIAALTIAGGISERAFQEYKEKVVEKLGMRQEQKVRDDLAQDRVNAKPVNSSQILIAGSGKVLCFDQLTGRYFESSMEDIKRAENKVNYELINFNSCSLTHFYDELGLAPTSYSDSVGWNMNNMMEVQISTVLSEDNQPCLAIDFSRPPIAEYTKHWD